MAAGFRSFNALWLGGSGRLFSATPAGGYHGLMAFWMGGVSPGTVVTPTSGTRRQRAIKALIRRKPRRC